MKELPWREAEEDKYIAEMQCGCAIIEPRIRGPYGEVYAVRLELPSGEVVAEDNFDFDTAQAWAQVNLPLLDLVVGEFSDCGLVGETLDLCQQMISRDTGAIHLLRIEHVKKWMARYSGQTYDIIEIPIPEYPPKDFTWIEDGKEFYVDTPHGRATITEVRDKNIVGGGLRHKAQIVHPSGAVLQCDSWIDFMEAEDAIKQGLEQLLRPAIWESQLPCIGFTLDVCEHILPANADPIHSARLGMLGMRIHLALE